MDYKKEIQKQLETLKSLGRNRREVETDLGYKVFYLDQAVSKGGNDKLLTALKNHIKLLKSLNVDKSNIHNEVDDRDAALAYAKKDPLNKLKSDEWELVGRYMRDELAFYMAKATNRRLQDCLNDVNSEIVKLLQQ